MYGFNSNFNDIQKQISFANLTGKQIQKFLSILQTKRSEQSKLSTEEKVFLQWCRERGSCSANKYLDTVVYPIYGSIKIIKNGTKIADRDTNANIVQEHLEIPLVLLSFTPNYLL